MSTATNADWVPQDTLGARTVLLRHSLGLSRRQFSQLTGVTEAALQGIEEGRSPHRLPDKIQKIHNATGVSREWLMWGGALNAENPRPEGPGGGEESTLLGLKVRSYYQLSYRGNDHDSNVIPLHRQAAAA